VNYLLQKRQASRVSRTAICRSAAEIGIKSQKKTRYSSQATTERVQKFRCEYWEKIKDIPPEKFVFLDEMGIIVGPGRTHARIQRGTIIHDLKPFYRGQK
jgi:hypothetical protein